MKSGKLSNDDGDGDAARVDAEDDTVDYTKLLPQSRMKREEFMSGNEKHSDCF